MRKLIIKAAAISFASAIGALLVFALVALLAFPMASSNAAMRLGMNGAAAGLARSAYERDGSEDSLKALVDRAIIAQKNEIIADYCGRYLSTDTFKSAKGENIAAGIGPGVEVLYGDYIAGSYAVALYYTGDRWEAINVAEEFTEKYTGFCPARFLVNAAIENGDAEFALRLSEELGKCVFESAEERELLAGDLESLSAVK